mmetsp:Transcript_13209/g.31232  ORF Transcript_13209/g.31232 Transcript_13209/m.31232 type:complete len:210 (+) Transcript_13209:1387-2016(+)
MLLATVVSVRSVLMLHCPLRLSCRRPRPRLPSGDASTSPSGWPPREDEGGSKGAWGRAGMALRSDDLRNLLTLARSMPEREDSPCPPPPLPGPGGDPLATRQRGQSRRRRLHSPPGPGRQRCISGWYRHVPSSGSIAGVARSAVMVRWMRRWCDVLALLRCLKFANVANEFEKGSEREGVRAPLPGGLHASPRRQSSALWLSIKAAGLR